MRYSSSFMPEYSVTNPACVQRPLVDPVVERTISLVTLPGRKHTPAAAAFIHALRAYKWG